MLVLVRIFTVKQWTVLQPIWNKQTDFWETRTDHIFVPKFHYDRANYGFLKHLK